MRSDDEKLVSQTLSGDQDAFGVLVHKYQEMVYAYAFQKMRNEADAQDVTQEVFWRTYHHPRVNCIARVNNLAGRCQNATVAF